jgi:hypothetical protein
MQLVSLLGTTFLVAPFLFLYNYKLYILEIKLVMSNCDSMMYPPPSLATQTNARAGSQSFLVAPCILYS